MISLFLAAAVAAASPSASTACDAKPDCRWVGSFELRGPDGAVRTVTANTDLDFVDDGRLILLPGEMVLVKLSEGADGALSIVVTAKGRARPMTSGSADELVAGMDEEALKGAKPMASIPEGIVSEKPPADTLRLSFQQLPGKTDMTLVVENGYARAIDYNAGMLLPGRPRVTTTACELQPNLVSFEHWPHPIIMLDLGAFRFLPASRRGIACD